MKFNHIIYNSSQINRNGSPGFGERAVTIGTDPELLKVLNEKKNDFYVLGYSHPKLNASALQADPSLIRLVHPSYMFRSAEYAGKKAWVVSRKIATGFDYSFYANGNPTRLGPYVADLYIFDAVPPREVFEVIYENAAPGSVHFIPASPEPTTDNVEMQAISLGQPRDFAPEDRSFKAASLPGIDARAIKLLFAFYDHLSQGKPVAIAISDDDAVSVIGSFMRIVPEELIGRATFVTNYNGTGAPEGIALVCVDPERSNYFPAMSWIRVDLTNADAYPSTEAAQLQGECEKALADGNLPHLLNMVRWLFSSEYRSVKAMDEPGREIAFRYIIEPQTVTNQVITQALTDDAAVKALVAIIDNGASTAILDRYFDSKIATAGSVAEVKAAADLLLNLDAKGLHCAKAALKRGAAHIDAVVLASAASLEEFYHLAGATGTQSLMPYAEFLNLESLKKSRNGFLSALKPTNWRKLYSLFFATPIDEKALARRSVTDKLPDAERNTFLSETIAPERLVDIATALILENEEFTTAMLPILSQLQDCGITPQGKRYFDIFAKKRDTAAFAELMVKEYGKSIPLTPVDKEIERIEQLAAHPGLVRAISDVKLSGVLKSLKSSALSAYDSAAKTVAPLCDRIAALPLKSRVIDEVKLLADVLRGNYKADALKVALVAVETGQDKAVLAVLPSLASSKIDSSHIDNIISFLLKKGADRVAVAGILSGASEKQLSAWFSALYAEEKKHRGTVIVTELEQAGLTNEKAVALLEIALPDDHKAYVKSLQPGIFARFGSWVKGLFNKKPADTPNDAKTKSGQREVKPNHDKQNLQASHQPSGKPKQPQGKPAVATQTRENQPQGKPAAGTQPTAQTTTQATPEATPQAVAVADKVEATVAKAPSMPSVAPKKAENIDTVTRDRSEIPDPAPDPSQIIENEGEVKLD